MLFEDPAIKENAPAQANEMIMAKEKKQEDAPDVEYPNKEQPWKKNEEVKGQELVKKKSKEEVQKNPLVDG